MTGEAGKLCTRCEERPRRPKQRWCKDCHARYVRENREANNRAAAERRDDGQQDCGPLAGVYFVECGGFIKIGVSTNVCARYYGLQNANPFPIVPLGFAPEPVFDNAELLEATIHLFFAAHRYRGEWFHDCAAIREYINTKAAAWPDPVQLFDAKDRAS